MKAKGGKWKATRDPNRPKRPPSPFFFFMEEFRKRYKKEHLNNTSVTAVGIACGRKWRSMNEQEKAPYVEKASKHKQDYEQKMESYYKKPESSHRSEQKSAGNRNQSVPHATASNRESVISALHKRIEKALEAYYANLRDDMNIKILKELKEDVAFELLGLELRLSVSKTLQNNSDMLAWRSMSTKKRMEWPQKDLQNYFVLE